MNVFDRDLHALGGLKWLPWIGQNFPALPLTERLLVIGESHYANDGNASTAGSAHYTRKVVQESFIRNEWTTRTLTAIQKLLFPQFPQEDYRRAEFWDNTCYFNFVQRLLGGLSERPNFQDFVLGWDACFNLIRLLKPACCLFIGVAAAGHFNWCMRQLNACFEPVVSLGKVGRVAGRSASLMVDNHQSELHFVKHAGSYFNASKWNAHLREHVPSIIHLLSKPEYSRASPSQLT